MCLEKVYALRAVAYNEELASRGSAQQPQNSVVASNIPAQDCQ